MELRNERFKCYQPKQYDSKEVLEELFFLDLKSVVYRRVKRFNIFTNSSEVIEEE